MNSDNSKPEWVPENADKRFFTTSVMPGVNLRKDGSADDNISNRPRPKRKELSLEDFKKGVLEGNKTILARAITMVESNAEAHFDIAQQLVSDLQPHAGKAFRIGITGVPGAGKSSFIEAFGTMLCREYGKKVAVLAVDPSSTVTGGSVLGDKTRMENLSRCDNAFIRPSPSGGMLGGVARKSRETMVLCEAAGYDVILVETVGVGQSETAVHSMVDFFLLIQLAGTGDELQGIKRGIMEMADGIAINKADGDNIERANLAAAQFRNALHLFPPTPSKWVPEVVTYSGYYELNIDKVWDMIDRYFAYVKETGYFDRKRNEQAKYWMFETINEELRNNFYRIPEIAALLQQKEMRILNNEQSSFTAAHDALDAYYRILRGEK